MTPLVIRVSKVSAILRLIFSTAASSLFIACLLRPRNPYADEWICLILGMLFGGYALYGLWLLFDPSPRLLIDDTGIDSPSLGVGVIPWRVILDAHLASHKNSDHIHLVVHDPEPWLVRMPFLDKAYAYANWRNGSSPLQINVTSLAIPPYEILQIIRQQISEHHADKIPA